MRSALDSFWGREEVMSICLLLTSTWFHDILKTEFAGFYEFEGGLPMKKFLCVLFLFLLCLMVAFSFAACNGDRGSLGGEQSDGGNGGDGGNADDNGDGANDGSEESVVNYDYDVDAHWSVTDESVREAHALNETKLCRVCGYQIGSEGLEYAPNDENEGYTVVGIGTADGGDIVIPSMYQGEKVTAIGERAFSRCDTLTSVVVPKSVTNVGKFSFSSCEELRSVKLSGDTVTIGYRAFGYCKNLVSVALEGSVSCVGEHAFDGCHKLASIAFPNGLTDLAKVHLKCASALRPLVFPTGW